MNEDELGMHLIMDDEFYDEAEDNLEPPVAGEIVDNTGEPENTDEPERHNEEPNDDEDQDRVGGDNTEDGDEPEDEDDDNSSSTPLYKSLASYLQTEGMLSSVDSSELEKVESIADLTALLNKEAKSKELSDLTDLQREAVEALRAGIDLESFQKQKVVENNLDSITDEILQSDQELRENLIYQDFINQGFSEQKARRLTDRSVSADDDIEDALEALENIRNGVKEKFEEEKAFNLKQKEEAALKYKTEQEELKKSILEKEEPFKGYKVNDVARKEILSTMLNPVGKNPNTGADENSLMKDQRENKDFNQRLYAAYTLSKGFTDFSFFGKNVKKGAVSDFERALKNNQHILAGGSSNYLDDPDASDFDIGDNLVVN